MKRKAILIESSNVSGQTELPGARLDIRNWKNFLKSDMGGNWNDSEIVELSNPYSPIVADALKVDADCYCFVAFSGHGMSGSVVLNESYTEFPIYKLHPSVYKATVIIDACRGIQRSENFSFGMKVANAKQYSGVLTAANSLEGRETVYASAAAGNVVEKYLRSLTIAGNWESALNKSANGVVEMFACSVGQGAGEDPKAGGYYTSLLLQAAEVWYGNGGSTKVYTTKEAHDYAATYLPPQQKPEYKPLNLAFPFAVKG